ncbi:MAG: hypothetical protein K0R14_1452 [Burkholderiales bacterium]|jgi:uncharacterized integral membrane protein (TIGR00697 family)|nr:hypothetical protein [Burkholderiales bacterium]
MLINKVTLNQHPKALWFLLITYVSVILLANWFDIRLIKVFGLETDAGTLIFPLTFLCSDLITEVYGYKFARRAIWTGFLFNLVFILYGQLVIHLPSPGYAAVTNANFDTLLGFNIRIILASTLSYFCAEPLNSYLMAKLKLKTNGKYMSLRFVLSTFIASFFDSFIFGTLAFGGTMPNVDLIRFNTTMWLIKVAIEIIGLPVSLHLAKVLKKHEKLDIYDKETKFNVFSLDTSYTHLNNQFNQTRQCSLSK